MAQIVSIQGFEGSFHQVAARHYFGDAVDILPCASFREVVGAVRDGRVEAGLMAIENSIAGSILPNYGLLQRGGVYITGEVYLPIRQHLLVNRGVQLSDIREVYSHPMALQQCSEFLQGHSWKLVETEDTALSAQRLQASGARQSAAVAGDLAAQLFDLDILAPDIHTEASNYTRFLVLHREPKPAVDADKASICFGTIHQRGSLARVLLQVAEAGINLSKLQSFPVPGTEWEYYFHADLEFDTPAPFEHLLDTLKPLTTKLDVYGVYVNGRKQ